jgi:hypothetical protein
MDVQKTCLQRTIDARHNYGLSIYTYDKSCMIIKIISKMESSVH